MLYFLTFLLLKILLHIFNQRSILLTSLSLFIMLKVLPSLGSEEEIRFVLSFCLLLALCHTSQALFVDFEGLKRLSNRFISKVFAINHVQRRSELP